MLTEEELFARDEKLHKAEREYIKALEKCVNDRGAKERKETAEKFAERVSQAIVDNTYPSFDKDGKPVNIWKAVMGYDRIDEICKEITEGL